MGQVAFMFHPCKDCNPGGKLEMWGGEVGDPTYKPADDHRFKVVLKDTETENPGPLEPSTDSLK